MKNRKTNVMVVGKTGSGKTVISVDVMRTFYQNNNSVTGVNCAKTFRKTAKAQEIKIMTTNSNGAPGKIRHLNDIAVCCENPGMRVICVDDAESDFWLSASLPCATVLEGKSRISQDVLVLQRERGHCLFPGTPGAGMSITKQPMSRVFWRSLTTARLKHCIAVRTGRGWRRLSVRTVTSGIH